MTQPQPSAAPVRFDQDAAAEAIRAADRAVLTCESVRRVRTDAAAVARMGWQGRMRDAAETELERLEARLDAGIVAVADLRHALERLQAEAQELRIDVERRAGRPDQQPRAAT